MPYVKRDQSGQITAVSLSPEDGYQFVPPDDAEMLTFAAGLADPDNPFHHADRDFVRVTEDLIYLLIDKSILRLTDLPVAVQHKLALRRTLRGQQGDLSGIVPQGEEMPFL